MTSARLVNWLAIAVVAVSVLAGTGAGDVYGKAGLDFSCLPARPIQVAGTRGLDIQCNANRDGQTLVRQRIVMWSKPGLLASLSYTSSAPEFAAHLDAFNQTLASVAAD